MANSMQTNLEDLANATNPNTVSVRDFADRIKSELATSTAAWWKVADILGEADTQYGFSSLEMKALISDVGFTSSKANKLIQISKSDRLKQHANKFSTVSAWTVLYKLTTLSVADFNKVKSAYEPCVVVSVAWINRILGRKNEPPKDHKPLFTVQVNFSALKTQEFSGNEYQRVQEALEQLKETVPYIDITDSGLFDKECDQYQRDFEKAQTVAFRRLVRKAVDNWKANSPEWKRYRDVSLRRKLNLKQPYIGSCSEFDEVMSSAEENAPEVFDGLNADWYSPDLLMNETLLEIEQMRRKYTEKLKSS